MPMQEFPWKLWDCDDTKEPLAEGCEEALTLAAEGYARAGRTVLLEDPRGREWTYPPGR